MWSNLFSFVPFRRHKDFHWNDSLHCMANNGISGDIKYLSHEITASESKNLAAEFILQLPKSTNVNNGKGY